MSHACDIAVQLFKGEGIFGNVTSLIFKIQLYEARLYMYNSFPHIFLIKMVH